MWPFFEFHLIYNKNNQTQISLPPSFYDFPFAPFHSSCKEFGLFEKRELACLISLAYKLFTLWSAPQSNSSVSEKFSQNFTLSVFMCLCLLHPSLPIHFSAFVVVFVSICLINISVCFSSVGPFLTTLFLSYYLPIPVSVWHLPLVSAIFFILLSVCLYSSTTISNLL